MWLAAVNRAILAERNRTLYSTNRVKRMTISLPALGQIARVRQRLYLVEGIVKAPTANESTLVRLSCLDDDAQGQPLEVLWEKEVDAEPLTAEAWEAIARRGFDPPSLFSAYLHTLRWNCVTATDPRLFQSPFRAGIRIDAYQLEPLRKALRLPRVNLFIADDVGLGKTIEAGLIARELLLRKKVRDIVVVLPAVGAPAVAGRAGGPLRPRLRDPRQGLRRSASAGSAGYGVNPWTTHTRFLISHRLLIDEAYAGPLRDWLGDFRPGSLLILDEAHHAAPSSGAKYAIDSKITRAVRDLARRFEHRLFLSATPHNGHSNSFSALLEILDPQRFCRGVPVEAEAARRRHGPPAQGGPPRRSRAGFPERQVVQIDIDGLPADAPELQLLGPARPVPGAARGAAERRDEAQAGRRRPADLRPAAAAALLGRGVRPHPPRPPPDGAEAVADAAGRAEPSTLPPHPRPARRRPSAATTTGPRFRPNELQAEEDAQIEARHAGDAHAQVAAKSRSPERAAPRRR